MYPLILLFVLAQCPDSFVVDLNCLDSEPLPDCIIVETLEPDCPCPDPSTEFVADIPECSCTPPCPDDCPCSCHEKIDTSGVGVMAGTALEPFYDHPAATYPTYPTYARSNYPMNRNRGYIGGFGGGWSGGGGSTSGGGQTPIVPEPSTFILFGLGLVALYAIRKRYDVARKTQMER